MNTRTLNDRARWQPGGFLLALVALLLTPACIIVDLDGDGDDVLGPNDEVVFVPFSLDAAVTTQTRLRLEALDGNVSVVGTSGASGIVVSGEKSVGSDTRADALRRLDDLEVRLDARADEFVVRTVQPQDTEGRNYVVDYTIMVPPDLEVLVSLINGNVEVSFINEAVLVTGINGNVQLRQVLGDATVVLTNGNIDSEAFMETGGRIEHFTDNGNILLRIPKTASADFSARLTNGTITLDGLLLSDEQRTSRTLLGTLGTGAGTIELRTINGNIVVEGI